MVRRPEGLGLLLVYLLAALAMASARLGSGVCYSRTYGLLLQILTIRIPSHSHSCGACASSVSLALFTPSPQLHCASSSSAPPTLIGAQTEAPVPGVCTARVFRDLCPHPSRRNRKIPLPLVFQDRLLCLADFPGQGAQGSIFSTQKVKKASHTHPSSVSTQNTAAAHPGPSTRSCSSQAHVQLFRLGHSPRDLRSDYESGGNFMSRGS